MEFLNAGSLTTDDSGRVSFSGLRSGIDFRQAVEAIMQARRFPVDRLETKVETNTAKIDALKDLRGLLSGLRDSLSTLRGAVSFDGGKDAFAAKQAFATSSRSDGGTPTDAAALLSVNVTSAAKLGSHSVEVLQTAKAHKIGSATFSSTTDDLGTASGGAAGSISGNFTVNGVQIDVLSSDTLQDLRDRINNANTGESATGVSASIVSVSSSEHVLVLTADDTGTANEIALADPNATGVLADLGISDDGGTTLDNELQAPKDARLHVDGLLDASQYETDVVADKTAAFNTYTAVTDAGTASDYGFDILDEAGAVIDTVVYDDSDSLEDLQAAVDAVAGISASIVAAGGGARLEIVSDDGSAIDVANDTGGLLAELGLAKQELVVTRASNTIDDLFEGTTLNLFQAETGTDIKIDVERDLNSIKDAIFSFVEAYNGVKQFINAQRLEQISDDPNSSEEDENAGILARNRTLAEVEQRLNAVVGAGAQGTSGTARVLAQIGIDFVDNGAVADPTLADTLKVDEQELDEALLNRVDDVRALFGFRFSSSSPNITLLDFDGATAAGSYTLDLTHDGTNLTAATFDGVAGSATVDGDTLVATDATGAEGLSVLYTGSGDLSGVNVDITAGIGSELFFAVDSILDGSSGSVATEIDALTDRNEDAEERIDRILERLEFQRRELIGRFVRMEEALAELESVRQSLQQTTAALTQDRG